MERAGILCPEPMRSALMRPALLRAFARLAIAVLCAHAAQPLAAGLRAAHALPGTLAICTAAGLRLVAPGSESAPAPGGTASGEHCVFCYAGGAALPQPDPRAAEWPLHAASPLAPVPSGAPGESLLRPAARSPPFGLPG